MRFCTVAVLVWVGMKNLNVFAEGARVARQPWR
jgi:hypothetical protein